MKIENLSVLNPQQAIQAESILRSCVHCGLCNATCPTYQLSSNECEGPRGRIYLIKQVVEGQKASLQTLQHLDSCLTCRACETTCPSGVVYSQLLTIGREQLEKQVRRPWLERYKRALLVAVLPYPKRFAPLLAVARGLSFLLPQSLAKQIPKSRKFIFKQPLKQQTRSMLILEGCAQSSLSPSINQATAQVLQHLGISVISSATAGCCGALPYHLNQTEQALAFAKRNIDAWLPYLDQGIEAIVMTASGCGVMVKDYGELLKDDSLYADKARRISAATRDLVEIMLAEDLSRLPLKALGKIAVQSPCTLQHGQQLAGAMEQVLQSLGFALSFVTDSGVCCGSAGTYSLLQPQLAEQLGQTSS
ncbi:MAG: glycolate oxidase subunit GlcF [Methylococcaceae bacterium]